MNPPSSPPSAIRPLFPLSAPLVRYPPPSSSSQHIALPHLCFSISSCCSTRPAPHIIRGHLTISCNSVAPNELIRLSSPPHHLPNNRLVDVAHSGLPVRQPSLQYILAPPFSLHAPLLFSFGCTLHTFAIDLRNLPAPIRVIARNIKINISSVKKIGKH